jgi:PAS domain S-box-containing protein
MRQTAGHLSLSPNRTLLILGTIEGYVLLFLLLYPVLGGGVAALAILPTTAIAWDTGVWGGFFFGVLVLPLNTLLLNVVGETGWDVVFRIGGGPGIATIVLVGVAIGWMRRLRRQLQRELDARVRAEATLRENETRLRLLMEQIPALLWTTDCDLRFTSGMGAGLELFDLRPGQLAGVSLYTFFKTDDPHFPPLAAHRAALAGKATNFVAGWVGYTFQVYVEPFRDEAGQIVGCIGIALDITARVQAEEAARQAQKLESLGIMAGGVAHDFNNLLVAMLGQTSLALVKTPPDNPVHDHVRKAAQAAERAAALTRQLLAYSGRARPARQAIDLNNFIRENRPLLQAAIPRQVRLQGDLTEPLPWIEGDEAQLHQALLNLVLNGAQAIGDGEGTVTIATGVRTVTAPEEAPGTYTGRPVSPGKYVTLAVRDNGRGIDDATLGKIFDPFFTTKKNGHGLGLATVLGIVRSHQGDLQVESKVGVGTTFHLLFPARAAAPAAGRREEKYAIATAPQKKVLVVDDDETVRETVCDMLAAAGIEVFGAANGEEGLACYRAHRDGVGLVLLDLTMPGWSGEETLARLRKLDTEVPVIISSGYSHSGEQPHLAAGVDYLAKPYDASTLLARVRQHL